MSWSNQLTAYSQVLELSCATEPESGAKAELASGKHVTYLDDHTRLELISCSTAPGPGPCECYTCSYVIPDVFPCFIRAPSDSNAKPIEQLYPDERFKDILLALERTTNRQSDVQEWWIVDQSPDSVVYLGGVAPSVEKQDSRCLCSATKSVPRVWASSLDTGQEPNVQLSSLKEPDHESTCCHH
ncbi:hypothetical protein WMY93_005478 [Mugilogobius chulae]|uniref:Piezo non-specific cation channel cap domain-containing protein n=1 Tax=Mugilogobius chulae TaxID=88201 RepID=A0AAW0PND1_9GOBI